MDIVLNGVSIGELQRQKLLIQADAAEFIAEGIESAKTLVHKMVNDEGVDQYALASEATKILQNVKLVSGISGVEYYLPYNSEWGDNEKVLSNMLDSADHIEENNYRDDDNLQELYSLLEDMEYTSKVWNTSTC